MYWLQRRGYVDVCVCVYMHMYVYDTHTPDITLTNDRRTMCMCMYAVRPHVTRVSSMKNVYVCVPRVGYDIYQR